MTQGIIVAKPGYDVKTASILQQVFNSSLNCLKILSKGSTSSNANGSRSVDIAHGLSYAPIYLVYFTVEGLSKTYQMTAIEPESGFNCWVSAVTDSTYLHLYLSSDTTKNITVNYILFVDPGE